MIVFPVLAVRNNAISRFEVTFTISAQSILLSINLVDYACPNLAVRDVDNSGHVRI